MMILVAVSVRELKFVGVEFEKTRNLKLVTRNFFVPLHPEIGLRAFFLRFATKAAEPSAMLLRSGSMPTAVQVACGRSKSSMLLRSGSKRFARSMQQSCVQSPAGVLSPLRYESGRAERNAAAQRKNRNFVNSK
jgi:hypothetical protein